MRDRRIVLLLLFAFVVALVFFRISYVQMGPDSDTDSYGHHAISRQLLVTPALFSIHWVWLPLFHYLQAIGIYFGATLQTVRYANVAATALLPLLLFAVLSRAKEARARTLLVACALTAANPIVSQMGTTGQPEPLFALLILTFVWSMDRDRYILAGASLGAACLVRYEAWAVLAVTAGWLVVEKMEWIALRRRAPRPWFVVFIAGSAILFWAILRWPADGKWFAFLNQTRAFANDAIGASSSFSVGAKQFVTDVGQYTYYVPVRTMGPILFLVPFGTWRVWKTHGPWFFWASMGCLAFITLSWITRSSLGLDRHFFVVVPFFAALAAHGIEAIVNLVNVLIEKMTKEPAARALGGAIFTGLAIACASIQTPITENWMHEWGGALAHGLPTARAAATFLDTQFKDQPTPHIFCDESTIELLTHLDRTAFDRRQLDDRRTLRIIELARQKHDVIYIATWMSKISKLPRMGKLIYQTPEATETSGIGVLRIEGTGPTI